MAHRRRRRRPQIWQDKKWRPLMLDVYDNALVSSDRILSPQVQITLLGTIGTEAVYEHVWVRIEQVPSTASGYYEGCLVNTPIICRTDANHGDRLRFVKCHIRQEGSDDLLNGDDDDDNVVVYYE